MKFNRILAAVFAGLLAFADLAHAENDPVANPKAQVVAGNARFTVLTDRLIRMEWAENGKFEDNATLAIINRNLPVPSFTTSKTGDGVQIKTGAVTLKYAGNGKFDQENLSVSFQFLGAEDGYRLTHLGLYVYAGSDAVAVDFSQATAMDFGSGSTPGGNPGTGDLPAGTGEGTEASPYDAAKATNLASALETIA